MLNEQTLTVLMLSEVTCQSSLHGHNVDIGIFPTGSETVNNLPATQETQVQSLSLEDFLEKEMATSSSILSWETHRWRSLVGYIAHEVPKRVGHE